MRGVFVIRFGLLMDLGLVGCGLMFVLDDLRAIVADTFGERIAALHTMGLFRPLGHGPVFGGKLNLVTHGCHVELQYVVSLERAQGDALGILGVIQAQLIVSGGAQAVLRRVLGRYGTLAIGIGCGAHQHGSIGIAV